MRAFVTGASSGIGREMAIYLNELGYDLIIVARDEKKLKELQNQLQTKNNKEVEVIIADLSNKEVCIQVYEQVKQEEKEIDFLINNAGFGLFGAFTQTDLETEINMIDTNIKAVHILTKLFLQDMVKKNKGMILNVASVAGFLPGPLMNTYYATKNYVLRFSQAIKEELRRNKSKVQISVLCPGPVKTNFDTVAGVKFHLKALSSQTVARYAIDKTINHKFLILPGISAKFLRVASKFTPDSILVRFCYKAQSKKQEK